MQDELVWIKNMDDSNPLYLLKNKNEEKEYEYYSENDNELINNLVNLTYVNIPSILDVLKKRYSKNNIYTNIGEVIISINPFKRIPIYDNISDVDIKIPHIYSLSKIAYENSKFQNQSILVSGESGSGKTENTKYILKYLCNNYSENTDLSKKIINCNYLIELFGNAKTVRNDNSSRFGKFIKLYLKNNLIIGAGIEKYLLEKSRISSVNSLEKSYHIFYLLCSNEKTIQKYNFKNIDQYKLLKNSNYDYVIDEFTNFDKLLLIFEQFNFNNTEIDNIFYQIRLVLELLNCSNKSDIKKFIELEQELLHILNIDKEVLYDNLITKKYVVSGEEIIKQLDDNDIKIRIKSYSEDLYDDIFNKIISKINECLDNKSQNYISILDIFGFEIFDKNAYEQLCINFTNEVLQQIYNLYIFKNEQIEYEKEKIDWQQIEYKKNDNIIKLFTSKMGLFSIINEQSILGSGSNSTIFNKLDKNLDKEILYVTNKNRVNKIFTIKHYAGEVNYFVDNYIEKNRIKSKSKKIRTNLEHFMNQLDNLKKELDRNKCYFIRCIKPNDLNEPNNYDDLKIYNQLLYSGVIEGIKIVLAGYPIKKEKKMLINEFRFFKYEYKQNIIEYLEENVDCKKKYQIGINKVFLKKQFYEKYHKINELSKGKIILFLQKNIRKYLARTRYLRILNKILKIQCRIRIFRSQKKLQQLKEHKASIIINRNLKAYLYTKKYNEIQLKLLKIQAIFRMYKEYKKYKLLLMKINSANLIIKWYRFNKYKRKQYLINCANKIYFWYKKIIINKKIKERRNVSKLKNKINNIQHELLLKEEKIKELEEKEIVINNIHHELLLKEEKIKEFEKKESVINNIQNELILREEEKIKELEEKETVINNIQDELLLKEEQIKELEKKLYTTHNQNNLVEINLNENDDNDSKLTYSNEVYLKKNNLVEVSEKMKKLYLNIDKRKEINNTLKNELAMLKLKLENEQNKKSIWKSFMNFFSSK